MKTTSKAIISILLIAIMLISNSYNFIITNASSSNTIDFKIDGDTLISYTGTDKTVSVPSTIKTIAESAFEGNTTMEELIIPDSVEKISYHSFADCTGLKKVTIGDGLVEISSGAFSNCIQLVLVEIGAGLKTIGTGVFAGATVLDEVTISEDNPYLIADDGALYSADYSVLYQVFAGREGSSFSVSDLTTEIKPYAFWGCLNLQSILLNNSLTEIAAYTFSNCMSLKSIEIPYSVKQIQLKAFEDCVNLSKVMIGPMVNYIHATAFDGCVKLSIEAEVGTYADQYAQLYDYIKTDQVEYEDTGYDEKEESDSSIWDEEDSSNTWDFDTNDILTYTKVVGNQAVMFIENSNMNVIDGSIVVETPEVEDSESLNELQDEVEGYVSSNVDNTVTKGFAIPKLQILDGTQIVAQANYLNTAMTSYTIPSTITTIGDFAFARSGLTSIVIPSSVTEIGYAAFYHCEDLASITIPDTVEQIDAKAFEHTQWMEDWQQYATDDYLVVGDGILIAYKGDDTELDIPEGIKTIGAEVFKGNANIVAVSLPSSLETIGEQAFSNCTSLEKLTGGVNVIKIQDRAFYNCPIQTVRINSEVEEIGLGAFASLNPSDDANRTIIFYGTMLPSVTYTDSASRLSDEAARTYAFGAIPLAIVKEDVVVFEDTILDDSQLGFQGLICNVVDEHDIACVATTLTEEELDSFEYLEDYYVSDTRYSLINENDIVNYSVIEDAYDFAKEGEILGVVTSTLFPQKELISAQLEGNSGMYLLKVLENADASEQIKSAYEAVFAEEMIDLVYGFNMELIEQSSNILIEKLGRQSVQIKLPVPTELDQKTFRFVVLDQDGQLENLDYTLIEEEEQLYILSELNHFSTFGFYVTGDIPEGLDATLATDIMDESPDTGMADYWPIILLMGCIFGSIAIYFIMNKKKTSSI